MSGADLTPERVAYLLEISLEDARVMCAAKDLMAALDALSTFCLEAVAYDVLNPDEMEENGLLRIALDAIAKSKGGGDG